MKVLIIDDDMDLVEVVSLSLETQLPKTVTVVAINGEVGIEMVRTENPDLVILDIGLPEMDGYVQPRGPLEFHYSWFQRR